MHQAFPNEPSIIVQSQITYSTYTCTSSSIISNSLNCVQSTFPFTGLSTNFIKPNSHDDRETAISYKSQSKAIDIRTDITYNPYNMISSITDIVYYSNIYQALIMTNSQSVYKTSVPLNGTTYEDCRQMDVSLSVMKESVIDRQ